ncbi:MAG: CgeB family protein, partial [Thermodesulfobacteriota bacterium]
MCTKQLFSMLFYYGDSYINALDSEGFSGEQIVPKCRSLQYKWAEEHSLWTLPSWVSKRPFRWYWTRGLKTSPELWDSARILTEQIKRLRPRFIWVFSGVPVSNDDLLKWRPYTESILLWWSSPLTPRFPYKGFDLILSGIPSLVRHFQAEGLNATYLPHAFDHRTLQRVPSFAERIPRVAFVGSLSRNHVDRIRFLDSLSRHVEIDFYGHGLDFLPQDSPLRERYYGPAWGKDLYAIYGSYPIVIHKNIDMAGKSASAKRLFEATGMGACVVTEAEDDLGDLFQPEREIVTYSSFEECVNKIKYLLDNPKEAFQIGKQAQARTLKDHSYERRVQQILNYMSKL